MYVEDTGSGDGDIRINVDGAEYTAEANHDLDQNGVDETVAVLTDDGYLAYTDSDSDGAADVMRTVDEQGNVVERARFDEVSGEWVPEQPDGSPRQDPRDDAGGQAMVVDTPRGDREVGPPTEDTNNDGRPDTAVVDTDGGQMLVTDVNGDGAADQMVRINDSGEVTVAKHTGDGEWTVVDQGSFDGSGQYASGQTKSPVTGAEDWLWESGEQADPAPSPHRTPDPGETDPASDAFWG
ncbi:MULTISPECIES: DUF6802 family protein [Actinopolyspora]|uniref:DUF6802 domain-containing protein n=2 Tax=Actinopolyspora TaxID=1849 RepID=A0A1H1G274_9ACTN|nr:MULTISPECIES: DUF6802 family protein [Actinopolyspora]NHD16290.1 hypothetical protein [Actinopolyspora sp. BKK2]NHE75847.1 hypothetical protein [Actinopolyspora sp. BKK1]SDR06956.1 hypothetical protein SAMN04489718_3361 [Actinopolyspora saharensis]